MGEELSILVPGDLEKRVHDVIRSMHLPNAIVISGPNIRHVPAFEGEVNWDCVCTFTPDLDLAVQAEFDRKISDLKTVFRLPDLENFDLGKPTRESIVAVNLLKFLVAETTKNLGRDASFLESQIRIRRRQGTPNWDANCEIAAPAVIGAFMRALNLAQRKFNMA